MDWKKATLTATSALLLSSLFVTTHVHANSFAQRDIVLNGSILAQPDAMTASDGSTMTTFMPIWYVGQALTAAGFTQFWNGLTRTWSITTPSSANFSNLQLGYGNSTIAVNGVAVKRVPMYVVKDPVAGADGQPTVYMPIWYVQQILKDAGVQTAWNGQSWSITTAWQSPASPSGIVLSGFVTDYGNSNGSLMDYEQHPVLNQIISFSDDVAANGTVTGGLDALAEQYAQSTHQPLYLTVSDINATTGNFDGLIAQQILNNAGVQMRLIQNLAQLIQNTPYAGINLDFELFPEKDRAPFSQFLLNLSVKLHAIGKKLSVDVPGMTSPYSPYDYGAIGAVSDQVVVMAYDYSYPGTPAGPIAPLGWVKQVLAYATGQIASGKILLGIPVYGYDWSNGSTLGLSLSQVDSLIASDHITTKWDATDEVPYFTYTQNSVTHTVYYENAQSTNDELALMAQYHLAGASIWRIGIEDSGIWSAMQQFAAKPAP